MKKWMLTTVAGALVVSGLGFGTVAMADHDDKNVKVVKTAKKSTLNEVRLTQEMAKQIALNVSKDGVIEEIHLEQQEGRLVYHVEFENRIDKEDEIYIDATTGHVTWEKDFKHNVEPKPNKPTKPTKKDIKITKKQAAQIALAEVPGVVDDIELERERGQYVYEVEIETEDDDDDVTVYVSATTGEVLDVEWDD